ncbi:TPA: hypothetical protein OT246_002391 [Klebsiella pneumoniae]|nr:hypothetical protein [Klebsiella pneumoniae]
MTFDEAYNEMFLGKAFSRPGLAGEFIYLDLYSRQLNPVPTILLSSPEGYTEFNPTDDDRQAEWMEYSTP